MTKVKNMLDKSQIEHIARLARLDLTEAEQVKYGGQISAILGYIEQLQEVDVDKVEPTAQVTGLVNSWREDEVLDWPKDENILALNDAPGKEGRNIKVKRVLG
jgi:aspartyl-tRNA(Asn)/glutamyl-tRNA(Gln) amidotransferase subunit C